MQCQVVQTPAVHCHCDINSAADAHSAGCGTSPVCLQHYAMWWHLMVLQYVVASFHLPSVSTANIYTVQYTKPYSNMQYQQSKLLWYSRCCFLRRHHGSLYSQLQQSVVWCLSRPVNIQQAKYKTIKFLFSTATSCWLPHTPAPLPADPLTLLPHFLLTPHTPTQNIQLPTYSSTFNLSIPHRNVLITLFNWVTNYWCWIVAEWNSRCRFMLVIEVVYWRQISISTIIASRVVFIKLIVN